MIVALLSQDVEDRGQINLIGMAIDDLTQGKKGPESKIDPANLPKNPTVRLDEKCFSCSRSMPAVLQGFKMACLNYHPSNIKYKS